MKAFECYVYVAHDGTYKLAIHEMPMVEDGFCTIAPTLYLPYWERGWRAGIHAPSVKDCMMRLLNLIPELQE